MDESDANFDIVKRHCVDAVKRHFSTFILTDIAFFNVKLIFIRIVSNMFFYLPAGIYLFKGIGVLLVSLLLTLNIFHTLF